LESSVLSDVTTSAFNTFSQLNTQAAAFTLSSFSHFGVSQGTIGAGSAVTTQTGYNVAANLTGATNNYGFRGLIPAAANRWNIYMDGTAANYLNGTTLIGSTTDNSSGAKLQATNTSAGAITTGISSANAGSTLSTGSSVDYYLNGVQAARAIAQISSATFTGTDYIIQNRNAAEGALTENMRITASGNVQIGSSTAFSNATKLQVTGDICVSSGNRVSFDSSANTLSIKSSSSGSGGSMQFYAGGTSSANICIEIASDQAVAIYNIFNRRTASYTLVRADAGKIIEMNVASANNLTVPANADVAYPIGTEIQILQYGAGQTTIVAAGGVTLRSKSGQLKIANQYTGVTCVKVGTDEWYVIGNLSA